MDVKSNPPEKKRPQRYKLYDKLNVKLKTLDIIIWALLAALILALAWGIFGK